MTEPELAPPSAFDTRVAWKGVWPEAAEVPIRIEAAAWRGKVVAFRIAEPWTRPATTGTWFPGYTLFYLTVGWFVIFPIACFIGMRNFRSKRADIAGMMRLATVSFVVSMLGTIFGGVHVPTLHETQRLLFLAGFNLLNCIFIAVCYVALEPSVRRHCPQVLVSWVRLIQGKLGDPLVAAHILKAAVMGLALQLVYVLIQEWLNRQGRPPIGPFSAFEWHGPSRFAGLLFRIAFVQLWGSLFTLSLFFLGRLWLKRDVWGAALIVLFGFVLNLGFRQVDHSVVYSMTVWVVTAVVLLRYGFLALYAMWLVLELTFEVPWTLDTARWYFGYSLAEMLVIVAIVLWACRNSLSGRSLVSDERLA